MEDQVTIKAVRLHGKNSGDRS